MRKWSWLVIVCFFTSGITVAQDHQLPLIVNKNPGNSNSSTPAGLSPAAETAGSFYRVEKKERNSGPRKFSLLLGGGAAAFLGVTENVLFNRANTGYQAGLFLGYRFSRLRHSAGIFGTFGNISGSAARQLSGAYKMTITARIDDDVYSNKYVDTEAGVMLWEFVRLSVGHSWSFVSFSDGSQQAMSLGTTTVGLLLRTGPLRWYVNGATYFNKDFEQFFVRPSAGVALQLYMIRFY